MQTALYSFKISIWIEILNKDINFVIISISVNQTL